jgi:pilus assembly protein Flp/PilA
MTWLTAIAKRFFKDEGGLSLVEYAMLIALIAIVGLAGITVMGNKLNSLFSAAATSI